MNEVDDLTRMDQIYKILTERIEEQNRETRAEQIVETTKSFEEARTELFEKFPPLEEAWKEYKTLEKLYGKV